MGKAVCQLLALLQELPLLLHFPLKLAVGIFQFFECLLQVLGHLVEVFCKITKLIPGEHPAGRGKIQLRDLLCRLADCGNRPRDKSSQQIIDDDDQQADKSDPDQGDQILMNGQPRENDVDEDHRKTCDLGNHHDLLAHCAERKLFSHLATSNLYPDRISVTMCFPSLPSFCRSVLMCVSTVRVPPSKS